MLAHVLAVLGLAVYAFEIYRTIHRFGARRPGMLGAVVYGAKVHILMAVALTLAFFILSASFTAVPSYVAPAGAVINAVYLVMALRYARRRSAGRTGVDGGRQV